MKDVRTRSLGRISAHVLYVNKAACASRRSSVAIPAIELLVLFEVKP